MLLVRSDKIAEERAFFQPYSSLQAPDIITLCAPFYKEF